jgi:hypothetical protein
MTLTNLQSQLGILGTYPHLRGQLYFDDTALFGPYPIDRDVLNRPQEGVCGFSFIPFVQ